MKIIISVVGGVAGIPSKKDFCASSFAPMTIYCCRSDIKIQTCSARVALLPAATAESGNENRKAPEAGG